MSDPTTCTNCSATLPASAAFCTSCGTPTAGPAAGEPADATRVDTPGLHDATQVYEPPPPAPWQPAESSPAGPPPGPPPPATWSPPPPAPPSPPAWQQPQQPAGAPSWGAPASPPAPAWGSPAGVAAAGGPTATAARSGGLPLGAVAAILGGVLSLVGLFTAWVEITVGGRTRSLSGWSLTSGDELLTSNDPYLILGAALAAIVVGILFLALGAKPILRIAAVLVGLVLIATPVRDWLDIADLIEGRPGFEATQAFGFFLTIIGGVVTVVAAVLPGKRAA